jgi:hypothetical protein
MMLIQHSKQIEYKLLQYQSTKMLLNEGLISMEFLTDDKKLILKNKLRYKPSLVLED